MRAMLLTQYRKTSLTSIRTFDLEPRLLFETRLILYKQRLVSRSLLSPPMERSKLEEIMRSVDLSVVVCARVSVCLCTRIGGDMHSNERLLVEVFF